MEMKMETKDENIYVFIYAAAAYFGNTYEYGGTFSVGKDDNWDDVRDHVTEEMNKYFEEYLERGPLPCARITSINEISKELYDRLHQEH